MKQNPCFKHLKISRTNAAGKRITPGVGFARGEALAKQKLSGKEGIYFACKTPAHGYADAFEMFVTASPPPPYSPRSPFVVLKKGESFDGIPVVKTKKGRPVPSLWRLQWPKVYHETCV
jgi:hypothetical protein